MPESGARSVTPESDARSVPSLEEGAGKLYRKAMLGVSLGIAFLHLLKDVVNQCLDFGILHEPFAAMADFFSIAATLRVQSARRLLSRQKDACRDKIMFVATNICLDKVFVATKYFLSQQAYFCRDKSVFCVAIKK